MTTPTTNDLERWTITVAGRERTYWLAPGPAGPAPLLVVLHGLGLPVATMAKWTGLATRGPAAGFATVFPEGVEEMWDDTGRGRRDGFDDDAFARALVDHLATEGIADPRKLFLVGLSNGGFFAERLARAGIVQPRGIVLVVSTTRAVAHEDTPHPRTPTAVLCFAGTADRLVPYDGGRSTGALGWFARRRVRPLLLDPSGRDVVAARRSPRSGRARMASRPQLRPKPSRDRICRSDVSAGRGPDIRRSCCTGSRAAPTAGRATHRRFPRGWSVGSRRISMPPGSCSRLPARSSARSRPPANPPAPAPSPRS